MSTKCKRCSCADIKEDGNKLDCFGEDVALIEARAKRFYETAQKYAAVARELPVLGKASVGYLCLSVYQFTTYDLNVLIEGCDTDDERRIFQTAMKLTPVLEPGEADAWMQCFWSVLQRYRATPEMRKLWHDYSFHFKHECGRCTAGNHESLRIKLGEDFLTLLEKAPETARIAQLLE